MLFYEFDYNFHDLTSLECKEIKRLWKSEKMGGLPEIKRGAEEREESEKLYRKKKTAVLVRKCSRAARNLEKVREYRKAILIQLLPKRN